MIPIFPKFKKIEIDDKIEFDKFTKKFLPYSDFNFVSLYSWSIDGKNEISTLNNNLVVKFSDYLTDKIFLSFLGNNKTTSTANTLISFSKKTNSAVKLSLVPHSIVKKISSHRFSIEEDRDNFDYIVSAKDLIDLRGKKFRGKKNFLNRFKNKYNDKTQILHLKLDESKTEDDLFDLFKRWEKQRGSIDDQSNKELKAIKRLLRLKNYQTIKIIGVYVDKKLSGFSINEILPNGYGMIHFQKTDISYIGAYTFLNQRSAMEFLLDGCRYINFQQDLGIESLRKAKLAYRPVKFLKKYIVSKKV